MNNTSDKEILNGVVIGFRKLIYDRYQYDEVVSKYEIPDSFDEERMARYRNFFLDQIYPHPENREPLEEAFRSLDNYLTHPDKLLRIVFHSAAIVFRHGRSIPRLMGAGIKVFKSFRTATDFEVKLVRKAKSSGKLPPYSSADINSFVVALRKKEIHDFVVNTTNLLELLNDKRLVREIITIMKELIARMKKSPKDYSKSEIGGLEIAFQMLIEGNGLFESLSTVDQKRIIEVVVAIEVDVLEGLFTED
jgi:hypothetical protein